MKKNKTLTLPSWILILVVTVFHLSVRAQEVETLDDDALNFSEDEIEKEVQKKASPSFQNVDDEGEEKPNLDYGGLSQLAPFSDIAVIQKKFLPKTSRFQFHVGLNTVTNNPFFNSSGYHGNFAFYFNEYFGLEIKHVSFTSGEKNITQNLSEQGVKTSTLVSPKSYTGLDLVFIPFYGKMALFNQSIVPYDFYFSLGGGTTLTSYKDEQAPTFHFATGQVFAISKAFAVRWDLSWNAYTAKGEEVSANEAVGREVKQNFNDLYVGLGLSWFFPQARYR